MLVKQPRIYPLANTFWPQYTEDEPPEAIYYPFWDNREESEKWKGYIAANNSEEFVENDGQVFFGTGLYTSNQDVRGLVIGDKAIGENYFIPAGKTLIFGCYFRGYVAEDEEDVLTMTYEIEAIEYETVASAHSFSNPPTGRVILNLTIEDFVEDPLKDHGRLWTQGYYQYKCESDTYGIIGSRVSGGDLDRTQTGSMWVFLGGGERSVITPYPYITNDRLLYERKE